MDKQSPIAELYDIDEAIENRTILMDKQVVPYKVYIRKIVEAATVSEVNRWDARREDAMSVFRAIPITRRVGPMTWLILLLGIFAAYYFLTPWFD